MGEFEVSVVDTRCLLVPRVLAGTHLKPLKLHPSLDQLMLAASNWYSAVQRLLPCSTLHTKAGDSAAPVTCATQFALFSLAAGFCLAQARPTRCSADCRPFAVSYQLQSSIGRGTVQPDSSFIKLLFTMWLLLSVRIFFRYSTSRPDLAYHRNLQSASTRSSHLATLFKTCMDAAIYPQTHHAATTHIPGLKNLLNMYVCCSQQYKSVRLINISIEALRSLGHRQVCRPRNSGR